MWQSVIDAHDDDDLSDFGSEECSEGGGAEVDLAAEVEALAEAWEEDSPGS